VNSAEAEEPSLCEKEGKDHGFWEDHSVCHGWSCTVDPPCQSSQLQATVTQRDRNCPDHIGQPDLSLKLSVRDPSEPKRFVQTKTRKEMKSDYLEINFNMPI
jgi:hypothetical protein